MPWEAELVTYFCVHVEELKNKEREKKTRRADSLVTKKMTHQLTVPGLVINMCNVSATAEVSM